MHGREDVRREPGLYWEYISSAEFKELQTKQRHQSHLRQAPWRAVWSRPREQAKKGKQKRKVVGTGVTVRSGIRERHRTSVKANEVLALTRALFKKDPPRASHHLWEASLDTSHTCLLFPLPGMRAPGMTEKYVLSNPLIAAQTTLEWRAKRLREMRRTRSDIRLTLASEGGTEARTTLAEALRPHTEASWWAGEPARATRRQMRRSALGPAALLKQQRRKSRMRLGIGTRSQRRLNALELTALLIQLAKRASRAREKKTEKKKAEQAKKREKKEGRAGQSAMCWARLYQHQEEFERYYQENFDRYQNQELFDRYQHQQEKEEDCEGVGAPATGE
jgi:hypothetical protein